MKIGNRPIVHTALTAAYHNILGSDNFSSFISTIRETGTENGYDIYIMGDIMETWHEYNEFMTEQVDGVTAYCVSDAGAPLILNDKGQWIAVGSYDSMVSGYFSECNYWSSLAQKFSKGFIPPLALGMTNRSLYDMGIDNWLFERTNPTLDGFKKMCKGIKPYIDPEVNMVVIYAWNEFHEGSVLEPTVENGFSYLDALRDIFCEEPAGGYPPNVIP